MKIQIVTHLLPHELDEFERQLCVLSQSSVSSHDVTLDVTLNLNTIDASQSKIPVDFFVEKFNLLQKYVTKTSWCKNHIFDVDDRGECKGINDKRRNSIRKYASDVDAFLYLDSDLVFPRYALEYLIHCAQQVKNKYYIMSPQTTKLWDQTWDHLVNSQFINNKYGDERIINPHFEVNNKSYLSDVNLIKCDPIKFGGGWFNLISSTLLAHTNIPDELGSYGVDDTYVMFCAQIMKNSGEDVEQYLMENVIVAENYLLRNNPYKNFISYGFTRDDCKTKAENNLRSCLYNFQTKNSYVLKK
jgi:hypothetical protein